MLSSTWPNSDWTSKGCLYTKEAAFSNGLYAFYQDTNSPASCTSLYLRKSGWYMLFLSVNSSWRTWEKPPAACTWLKVGGRWCFLFLSILEYTYLHAVWSFPVHITSFSFCVLFVPFCHLAISVLIGSAFLCSLLLWEIREWFGY